MPTSEVSDIVRAMARWLAVAALVAWSVGMEAPVAAQTAPKKEPPHKAYKLELKPFAEIKNGKIATVRGMAKPRADQFFVENVGVLQPIKVTVFAGHKGDKIDVFLGKSRWDEKLQTAATGPDGEVSLKTRTQGELRISVLSDGEPKPYFLAVWVGDEIKPELKPVVASMKEHNLKHPESAGPGGTGGGLVTTVLAIAVVVMLIVIVVLVVRKRGKR